MAAKAQPVSQDSTGSSVLSRQPPSISLASSVLASVIPLPEYPLIAYSVYTCLHATLDRLEQLELARRNVLLQNKGKSLTNSLLPAVHVSKDAQTLYVFAFGSTARTCDAHDALSTLTFETLALTESSSFTPASIYPCSLACSTQATPCERCLDPTAAAHPAPVQLLPRAPLRLPLILFLQAVRDRLVDDVTEASKLHPRGRSVTRFKGSFLLGSIPTSSEWGSGWENYAGSRPLISCNLQVHFSFSAHLPSVARLVIHPVMRPTYYLPLRSSLPLPAGTPVVLLPHGVPAYYLSSYGGPATALTAQFDEALLGLGAGDWKRTTHACTSDPASLLDDTPEYIVAWLAVQNKQGEDKGMPVIWPATLCVAYHANSPSAHARSSLPYIPELPSQLQASPPPPTSSVPATLSFTMASSPAADAPVSATTTVSQGPVPFADRERLSPAFQRRPSLLRSSPTSESLRAFRTLSFAKKPYARDVKKVASEVGGYVDSVLKERERERERIRKERQEQENTNARAKLASTNQQAPVESPAPHEPVSEVPVAKIEEAANPAAPQTPYLAIDAEGTEPESHPSVGSDHSGDSLFSPPDAAIDLPSSEDEQPPVPEVAAQEAPVVPQEPQEPPALKAEPEAGPSTMSFDPFNAFDSSWGQQSNGYMDMNIDYGMDFNMNMDSMGAARTGGAGAGSFDVDDSFEAFTEDDFDFFDAPSSQRSIPVPAVPPIAAFSSSLPTATSSGSLGLTPLVAVDGPLPGPGPPSATMPHSSPWTAHLGEPFTPRPSVDLHGLMDSSAPPELLPPSPTKTPSSHSAPATPSVQLADSYKPAAFGPSVFEPIPFAPSHREADGKYAIGKFALPSPPADDHIEPLVPAPALLPGWKLKYSAATDPRIGVVRKLIGVKRKSVDQGARTQRKLPLWESYREPEEWQSSSPSPAGPDSEESDDEPWVEDEEMTSASRPSTPPPCYLPLGPTLLRTHFHHAHLLPMCTPLRPPGMAVNATPGNTAPMSVPTPVSPAAILGAATEKSKSLEAAAQVLVKEVVENPVWCEAWRANASFSATPPALPAQVWQADARCIDHLLSNSASESPVSVQTLFGGVAGSVSGTSDVGLVPVEAPMLAVGKGESVIQLSPASLRFWEKLGLSPRSGPKDVTAFVFFEDKKDEDRETEIESWLAKVSAAYTAKNFGSHVAGSSNVFTKPGLAPIRFESLRKTLGSFVQEITTRHPHLVFYIAMPSHIISSTSTVLRPMLAAVRRFYKQHPQGDILVHFVPESTIFGTHVHPASSLGGLDAFVCSVYDRLLQPVSRAMSRKFFAYGPPVVGYFQAPAYSLVSVSAGKPRNGAIYPKVTFSLESGAPSLDVTQRHMLLHVGYQVSTCGRWILAACVDAEGEAHELKAWLTPDDDVDNFVVGQVWSFALEFAKRANVEWRIVVSKLGLMSQSEINAWILHLNSTVAKSLDSPPMHVTLLCVDTENPWTFLSSSNPVSHEILKRNPIGGSQPSSSKSSSRHTHTTFSEALCATYLLSSSLGFTMYPTYTADRTAKPPFISIPGSSESPFIPDVEEDDLSGTCAQAASSEPVRVPSWSIIICAPSTTDHASISTFHLFQLHVTHSPRSTYGINAGAGSSTDSSQSDPDSRQVPAEHISDIVRNFHELAVLSRTRWRLCADPALPFHLAALEIMRAALSGGAIDP